MPRTYHAVHAKGGVLVGGFLWGLAIALVAIWLLVKVVFGVAGAVFHLLLVAAVVVIVYNLIRAGASRRA